MTNKEKKKLYKDFTKDMINQAVEYALGKMDKAFESGAFDIDNYDCDYELPKIVATALLEEGVRQITPLYSKNKQVLNNLRKMI